MAGGDLRSTDLVAMRSAMQSMSDAVTFTNGKVNTIANETETLAGTWTGAAGTGFVRAIEEWRALCTGLLNEMKTFIDETDSARGIYHAGEDTNVQGSGQLAGAMHL